MSNKNPKPVTLVNLETGERINIVGMAPAARYIGTSVTTVSHMLQRKQAYKKWYIFKKGTERFHKQNIDDFMRIYAERKQGHYSDEADAGFSKLTSAKDQPKVSLRIDKHTVIMVTPDKANEKYAEQWRRRRETAGKREPHSDWIRKL